MSDKGIREEARSLNYLYDSGQLSLDDFLDQVHKVTGSDRDSIKIIFTSPQAAKNVELLDYIKTLRNNYKIGMLSNVATNWVREVLLDDKEQELFDAMVFSYEVGAGKPDPIMYDTVTKKLDVEPKEAVFIDDSPRYVEGARQFGLKTIHYQSLDQMKKELEKILAAVSDD